MWHVKVINVSKRYDSVIALDRVNLKVKYGEYFCIIGPSGSGKSTLLKVIAGIVRQDEGDVYIDGKLMNDVPLEERGIGLVFQEIYLFPHMNIWNNVIYSPAIKGLLEPKISDLGRELLDLLGIRYIRNYYPDELSLGVQQKVAIARALASGAKLLLLDEPLGSIDPRMASELRFELKRIAKELRLTVIHVTHNQEEAMMLADRIAIMRKGRIIQVGTPWELYYSPKDPFVARFLGGEANFFVGSIAKYLGSEAMVTFLDGESIRVKLPLQLKEGDKVVLTIKPEDVILSFKPCKGLIWIKGKVIDKRFMGKYIRYVVRLKGDNNIIVKTINSKFNVNDEVYVCLNSQKIIVFKYPKERLEKAIAYE